MSGKCFWTARWRSPTAGLVGDSLGSHSQTLQGDNFETFSAFKARRARETVKVGWFPIQKIHT